MNKQRCGGLILSLMGICLSVEMGSVIAQDSNQKNANTSTSVSKCNNNLQPVGVEFNREIERQPNFAKAYNDRGEANLRLGNCNKAIADFDRAIELLPDYSKALVNRGNAKSLLGKYDEAIADFDRVADNGDAIAGTAVAKILLKKREIRESLLASKKNSVSTEDRQEVSESQAQSFSCYGYEELKIEQKEVNTRRRFFDDCAMRYYQSSQESVDIIRSLNEAIRQQTTNPRAYYYRGMFRLAMEEEPGYFTPPTNIESGFIDKSKALQDFSKSIELNPNYIDAYIARANLSFSRLKFADAVSNYDRAILAEPNNPSLYEERGDNKICQGLTSQAMADFDRAIQLDPNNANAYYLRGFTKLVSGNKSGAIVDYNIAFDFGESARIYTTPLPREPRKLIATQNYSALYLQPLHSVYYEFGVSDVDTFCAATKAILANPDRPYAYYFRYEVRKKYDPEGAKQDLQRAKELILTHKDSLDLEGFDMSDYASSGYIHNLRKMRVELTRSEAVVGGNKRVKPSIRRKP